MRNKLAALACTVLIAGGALATATQASATVDPPAGGWDHTWTTVDAGHGGTVYIKEYGDRVQLCDTDADSVSPTVKISVQESSGAYYERYRMIASGGNGSCIEHRASDGGKYDLPEDVSIGVTIWLGTPEGNKGSVHYYVNDN